MCPGSASLGAASVFCTIATCLGSARPEASGMAGTASSARSGCSPSGTSALCVSNTKLTPSPSPWPASPRGARLFFLRLMASRATSQHVIFKARPCASTWVERSQGTDRTGRRQGGAPGPSARAGRDGPGARGKFLQIARTAANGLAAWAVPLLHRQIKFANFPRHVRLFRPREARAGRTVGQLLPSCSWETLSASA